MPDGDLYPYRARSQFEWLQHFIEALIDERHDAHRTAVSGLRQWLSWNGVDPSEFARAVAVTGAGLIAEAEAARTDGGTR